MEASYLGSISLINNKTHIKWYPSLALVNLDYQTIVHNTHLAMDNLWLLDAHLFQGSLSIRRSPIYRTHRARGDEETLLLMKDTRFYIPLTRDEKRVGITVQGVPARDHRTRVPRARHSHINE